jgi:hypothetical protein
MYEKNLAALNEIVKNPYNFMILDARSWDRVFG